MVPCQTHVMLKWQEHLNSSWAAEDSQTATRQGAAGLYAKLLHNKEVVGVAQPVMVKEQNVLNSYPFAYII